MTDPAPIEWTASEQGSFDAEDFFEYAGQYARDMHEPLREVADHITETIHFQFETEGGRSGRWAPLSNWKGRDGKNESYAEWKDRTHPGEPILRLTHAMESALLADNAWHVTRSDAHFGRDSHEFEKAGWHQEGADRERGGYLPQRPLLELFETDYQLFEQIFYDWLERLRGDAGRFEGRNRLGQFAPAGQGFTRPSEPPFVSFGP